RARSPSRPPAPLFVSAPGTPSRARLLAPGRLVAGSSGLRVVLNEERLQIRIRISNSPALAPAHALALIREMQQFAVEAAAPRAQNAGVDGAGGEAEQFADGRDREDTSMNAIYVETT